MKFVHRYSSHTDTIAAIATPVGEGGIAVIRISGNRAIEIAGKLFSRDIRKVKSHTIHFGLVYDKNREKLDEALVLVMHAPRTFTGEETVEIQCHGGRLIAKKVLERVFEEGARAAKPGEFCFQAFMNGKIDLSQAEAIQSLIGAKNEYALQVAQEQLDGALSKKVSSLQSQLTRLAAMFEAWIDFPEEDLEFLSKEEAVADLETVHKECSSLLKTFHQGKLIHEGFTMALVGSPNVGKSALMNALLQKDRAIVSPYAGTTRDIVEDDLYLNGLHFKILDTAGIHEGAEAIEKEGIKRSKKAIERADIILFVVDAETGHIDADIVGVLPKEKTLLIINKIDLVENHALYDNSFSSCIETSALCEKGIEELIQAIHEVISRKGLPEKGEIVITKERHQSALEKAKNSVAVVIESLQKEHSPEFLMMDIKEALLELGTICGRDVNEDILDSLFSQFCIGK